MQSSSSHLACKSPEPPPLPPAAQVTDEDLELYAKFLARDFGFDAVEAGLAQPAWYQERVGTDICTIGRARGLRLLTMQHCRSTHLFTPFPEPRLPEKDSLQDFASDDVRDALVNRTRRAALFARMTDRVDAGVVALESAVDADFDRTSVEFAEYRRMGAEEEDPGTPAPARVMVYLVLLLVAMLGGLWLVKRVVIG